MPHELSFIARSQTMRVLSSVTPTPEQLKILEADTYQTVIIRGSAGSGKTSAAALRFRKALAGIAADRELRFDSSPIRVAVLTFNRTLKGYIENLIDEQIRSVPFAVDPIVDTFAHWSFELMGYQEPIDDRVRKNEIARLWGRAPVSTTLDADFISDEVDYVLGRFGRDGLSGYLGCERVSRGKPTLVTARRQSIIEHVITPYLEIVDARGVIDWNDCALRILEGGDVHDYDIIVADEVQDFTVQQLRALRARLKPQSSLTIVIDTAQSIYPKHIEWSEVGLDPAIEAERYTLNTNYRNSPQIAQFVQPLLTGIRLSDDGTVPNYRNCRGKPSRRTPTLFSGLFSQQLAFAIQVIKAEVNLDEETVAILTLGGDGKGAIAKALNAAGLPFCNLQRQKEWPRGPENIGVSTLHSSKGLEFDHVFILGFDNEFIHKYEEDVEDYEYRHLRMLLAMAITRAKLTVVIGYREAYRPPILNLFDRDTYLKEPA
ncbi:MAG: 3'-5' exonuclease [Candidatus Aquilonibacter sp.]|jgi:superfamily I DNA/RNA helicase